MDAQKRESGQPAQTVQRLEKQLAEKDAMIAQGTKNVLLLTDAGVIDEVQMMIRSVRAEWEQLARALVEEQALVAQGETEEIVAGRHLAEELGDLRVRRAH